MNELVRGSAAHREWVAATMRSVATRLGVPLTHLSRSMVEAARGGEPTWPQNRDFAALGGFAAARASAVSGAPTPPPGALQADAQIGQPATQIGQPPPAVDALELHRLRARVRDLERERVDMLGRLDVSERMREHVSAIAGDGTPIGVQRRERSFGRREATAVALASDWHVEEYVDPGKVNDVNAFDLSIAERSARRYFEGIVWLLDNHREAFAIRDLVLWLGGDLFTGHIHEDNVESTAFSPLLATRFVRELVVRGIRMLLAETELEQIIVPCSRGNHGRTTHKPRIATGAEHSYEQALYYQLADDFANEPRVRFSIARGELLYLDVYDRTIRFTHGDSVKYAGGVGGIGIPINKAVSQWDAVRSADLTCMGHWHQYYSARRVVVNGSLIGYSPYSVRIKADFEPPQQAFFLVDSRRGVCQSTPIWVREDDAAHVLDPVGSDRIRAHIAGGERIAA